MSQGRLASTLVLVEHNHGKVTPITLNAVSAAQAVGGEVTALVAGGQVAEVAQQMASVGGVGKVLVAQDPAYDGFLPGVCVCFVCGCMCVCMLCVCLCVCARPCMYVHKCVSVCFYMYLCVCRVRSPSVAGSAEQAQLHPHLSWSLCHWEGRDHAKPLHKPASSSSLKQ